MVDQNGIVDAVASRALSYLTRPPADDDPVIELLSPQVMAEVFDQTVGLGFADRAEAHHQDQVLAAVDQIIRYSVHTSHPRFLNQNFAGPDPVSVVGDWLGAALNTTGATYEAAPVFTLMEHAVLDKLARLAGYRTTPVAPDTPSSTDPTPGLFCPGGSTATLYGLQLARHRHQPDIVTRGSNGERLVLFVSAAGHYSAAKSAALLGLGRDAVITVASDHDGAIDPDALADAVAASRRQGGAEPTVPFAVIATAGTTVTSAFDDLNRLADLCERENLWLHVDGCYGGSALFSDAQAHRLAGVERSDSFVWNLHKMLGMTQQCSVLLVKDPAQLGPCFATSADYLFQPDKLHADYDSGDRTFQCARRIDVLKLWLTWKVRGDQGFADRIDHAVAMADHARSAIARSGGAFVPVVAGSFANVVFAWIPPDLRPADGSALDLAACDPTVIERLDRLPPRIKARLQAEGSAMLGFQPMGGHNTFRLLFMNPSVTTGDVDAVLAAIDRFGRDLDR